MEKTNQPTTQAPASIHADDDGASTGFSAGGDMARLLEMMVELRGEVGSRLNRLENRLSDDEHASVESSGSSTFRQYAEGRAGLGRRMTLSSLEDEVMRSPARQPAAGPAPPPIGGMAQPHVDVQQAHAQQPGFGDGYQQESPGRAGPRLTVRDLRVSIEPFSGKELYKGLGAGFATWGRRFLRQLGISEELSGVKWIESVKLDVLGWYLTDKAGRHFNSQVESWFIENPTLWYAMDQMNLMFGPKISKSQALKLFTSKKEASMSWNDHLLYMLAVGEAVGGAPDLILENIAKYASPREDLQAVLLARYNPHRVDYLRQAEELVHFAQLTDQNTVRNIPRTAVAAMGGERGVAGARQDNRACFKCGQRGHLKKDCPDKGKGAFVLAVAEGVDAPTTWILDSGSSRHLVRTPEQLINVVAVTEDCLLPNGENLRLKLKGSAQFSVRVDGALRLMELRDVYYAEDLPWNIISYGKLEERGYELRYEKGARSLVRRSDGLKLFDVHKDTNNVLIVRVAGEIEAIERESDVMMGKDAETRVLAALEEAVADSVADMQEGSLHHFHLRLGHLAYDTIERIASDSSSGIKLTDKERPVCVTCAQGKQRRNNQSRKDSGAHAPIDRIGGVICSDIKGPITPRDWRGNRYMINFVDHKTNYCRIFLAKTKDQATKQFEHFLAYFEKRFDCRIHCLRTDGGGEYKVVDPFCKSTGVRRQVAEAENQASNGKAERMHQTVMNMVRSMIFGSGLPLTFWGDAAEYASYILNRSPTRSNPGRASPLEMLTGQKPNVTDIVVFGSPCTAIRVKNGGALGQRAEEGLIIGKNDETKGFRVLFTKDRVVRTTQHVKNVQTLSKASNAHLLRRLEELHGGIDSEPVQDGPAESAHDSDGHEQRKEQQGEQVAAPAKAKKSRGKRGGRGGRGKGQQPEEKTVPRMTTRYGGNKVPPREIVGAIYHRDPKNWKEAMATNDSDKWRAAAESELASLRDNGTWELAVRRPDMRPLHTKWVFKTKTDADGNVERYKARMVACGNEQIFGENYGMTFSAVMDSTTAKVILVLSMMWGVAARHGDVPNAYVKAETEPGLDIYLHVPQGMVLTNDELRRLGVEHRGEVVLRLRRSLYGLKQAGRLWAKMLHDEMVKGGFTPCVTDSCMYYKRDGKGVTVVGVYVDDLLVTGTSDDRVDEFFNMLVELQIKNLGTVSKFLGMRVRYEPGDGYLLDQEATIEELLDKFGLKDAHPVTTPITLEAEDKEPTTDPLLPMEGAVNGASIKNFQSIVGSLLWLARCTRPDIAFAVHRATRRTHAPTASDWALAKRIARYLKGTKSVTMRMGAVAGGVNDAVRIESFSDADYAGDKCDRKSVSGVVVLVNGAVIGWYCKKQTAVALSTMEAEFVAAAHAAHELLGLHELLGELGVPVMVPMPMHMDNQAAIKQIENETSSAKAKHIDIKYKVTKDLAMKGLVEPVYVPTNGMIADVLTKPFAAPRLRELRGLCAMLDGSSDRPKNGEFVTSGERTPP